MNRKLDNDMGPSAERIDALIDSFNSDDTNEPDIDPELIEIAATIRGLRRRRAVVWPENTGAVPHTMARRLAGLVQSQESISTSTNGVYFASNPVDPAIDWDRIEAADAHSDEDWSDVPDDQVPPGRSRTREALRLAAAVIGFGMVAAALIAIFRPGYGDQGLGADPGASTVGELLYVSVTGENDSDIMLIDDDGSNARNVTNNPGTILWPSWSPDGQQIAFVSEDDGSYRIHVMQSDGSGRQPVAASIPGDQFLPVWSPDGSQIAFRHHSPPDENGDIAIELAIVDLATRSWRAVATAYVIHQNDLRFPLMLWPDWSPDGKWLAFARGSDAATGSELAVVRPSGDQLINYRIDGGFIMVPPAWSPDGRYLAYGTGGTSSELIVRDFLTDKVVQTALIPTDQIGELIWSADGAELFFSTLGSSTGDILKMSVASGAISHITDWIGREYIMDLSPDGSRIVVLFVPPVDTRAEDGEEVVSQLIVMDVDGTDRRVLATHVGVGASWRPPQ